MYSDAESEELCRLSHPLGVVDVQQKPSSPPKTNEDKFPNVPEIATTRRDASTYTESLIKLIEVEVVSVNPMYIP